jgi:beta-lactamase regulating signal transducer with metallopeptidase domain
MSDLRSSHSHSHYSAAPAYTPARAPASAYSSNAAAAASQAAKTAWQPMTPHMWAFGAIAVLLFAILISVIFISRRVSDCDEKKNKIAAVAGNAAKASWFDALARPGAAAPQQMTPIRAARV